MTWKQAKAEALRLVEQATLNRSELHLTEYQSQDRYLAGHPTGRAMGAHNLIVRAAMREASRRGLSVHRKLVKWERSQMPGNVPEDNDAKRSNVIEMPSRKPNANPTPEDLELWRLEGLGEAGYFQPPEEEV
jgi:hypothetical protein